MRFPHQHIQQWWWGGGVRREGNTSQSAIVFCQQGALPAGRNSMVTAGSYGQTCATTSLPIDRSNVGLLNFNRSLLNRQRLVSYMAGLIQDKCRHVYTACTKNTCKDELKISDLDKCVSSQSALKHFTTYVFITDHQLITGCSGVFSIVNTIFG